MRDDVKIFDFGLACVMTEERRNEGTQDFLLSKDTGSLRYMAPEVYKGVPYNEKCDVYSYGLILWQCLELALPFKKLDSNQMGKQVYRGKLTPKVNPKWSSNIKAMISNTKKRLKNRLFHKKINRFRIGFQSIIYLIKKVNLSKFLRAIPVPRATALNGSSAT